MGNKVKIEKIYNLTSMKEGMILYDELNKENDAYIEQSMFIIKGCLNVNTLEETFNKLIERYEAFRSVFISKGINEPVQVVVQDAKLVIHYEDLTNYTGSKEEYIKKFEEEDRRKGFDLTKAPLTRVSVLKLDEEVFQVVWSFHHIIMDGWCMGILIDEMFKIYDSINENYTLDLPKVHSYSKYMDWLKLQDEDEAEEYWKEYMSEYEECACIINSKTSASSSKYDVCDLYFKVNKEKTGILKEISNKYGVTLSTIIQSIWGIMLQRYNSTKDVIFGAVVSGRPAEVENVSSIVGLFINTIPVRVKTEEKMQFNELLLDMQNKALQSDKYQYYSLAKNQSNSLVKENLINNIVAFENYPESDEINNSNSLMKSNLLISDLRAYEQTSYDFNFIVLPGEELTIRFNYNGAKYDTGTIERIKDHFINIVNNVVENDSIIIDDIDIIGDEEKEKILNHFNNTNKEYENKKNVIELFEEQVEINPENIAIVDGEEEVTYKELDKKSNLLASKLLENERLGSESIISIMMDRSINMIVSMLAVLKVGAAYLPIDPEYPSNRIEYILQNSKSDMLITQKKYSKDLDFEGSILNIEEVNFADELKVERINNSKYDDLAYIIYTSGTTGNPKGVMIEHRNLINLCKWHVDRFGITEKDNSAQYASMGFDACVWEIWPYIISGSTIYIVPNELKIDILSLNNFYNKNNITVSFLPTPICQSFIEIGENSSLRYLLTGGDKLVNYKKQNYKLVNNYGPTENTVVTTSFEVDAEYSNIPIGKPIYNTKVYILDKNDKLAPIGVSGEICISGSGISRGYLNNEKLTKEKFIDNPYNKEEKMYRTGDLGKWTNDGNIEFQGRSDYQVKIRGFRIELGEIESNLLKIEGVTEATVLDIGEGDNKHLCAYITTGKELSISYLKEVLKENLPKYMVPTYFIILDRMPLTPNGKVDKRALLKVEINNEESENIEVQQETNDIEKNLLGVWEKILGVKGIKLEENFFDIGGNSLLVLKMFSLINNIYKDKIKITDIFANPTIKELAKLIGYNPEDEENYEIEGLKLSDEYFLNNERNTENSMFEYTIDEDMYSELLRISDNLAINIETILIATNIYINNKISDISEQVIYTILDKEDKVKKSIIDLKSISNFTDLFMLVKEGIFDNEENVYDIAKFNRVIKNNKEVNIIYPLIYNNELDVSDYNLEEIFNLSLSVEKFEDYLKLKFNYNTDIIKTNKVEEMFGLYINLLEMIIKNY
ncbi:MAG: amino acid adenylation domain-containing protein [Clostridium sp.]|nr:amino acid adenylation domain-containing protein [Clostridium sp.]